MKRVYLDWNATTPPAPEVIAAMGAAAAEAWANPSSVHGFGRAARSRVEGAREAVARLAGCDPRDVVLTSGGTEANNLALRSAFAEAVPGGMPAPVLLTSRLEHPSVTRVAEALEHEGKARVRWLRVLPEGTVDLDDLGRGLEERPRLVAVQAINAETGVIQPLAEVMAAARRNGVRLHVDAVQAFGRIEGTERLAEAGHGADTRSLAGHKMRGPKSIGALITRPGVRLSPVLVGGSQERGIRPGTIDPVAAAGLGAAIRRFLGDADEGRGAATDDVGPIMPDPGGLAGSGRWRAVAVLRDTLEDGLLRLHPRARVNGAGAPRASHVSNVAFPGWLGPELVAALDLEGIAVSSGTACSAGTAEPSPVLAAMGDVEAAACSVRFSLGEETTAEDVELALVAVARIFSRQGR